MQEDDRIGGGLTVSANVLLERRVAELEAKIATLEEVVRAMIAGEELPPEEPMEDAHQAFVARTRSKR